MNDVLRRMAALVLLPWSMTVSALPPNVTTKDMRHKAWGPEEGAPHIAAMTQTRDGHIWIGSGYGLYRFDGERFQPFDLPRDPRLASTAAGGVFATSDGGLWASLNFSGMAFIKDGHVTYHLKSDDGRMLGGMRSLTETADGVVWAASPVGVFRFQGTSWHGAGPGGQYPMGADFISAEGDGSVWAYGDQVAWVLRPGARGFEGPLPTTVHRVFSIVEFADGKVWAQTSSGNALTFLHQSRAPGHPRRDGCCALLDRDGGLWVEGGRLPHVDASVDLAHLQASALQPAADDSPLAGILEDPEGNVWIGTETHLHRLSAPAAHGFGAPPQVVWPPSILVDGGGQLWLGSHGPEQPLWRLEADGTWAKQPVADVNAMLRGAHGDLWFGGATGLKHEVDGRFETIPLPGRIAPGADVQAMAEDGAGGLWVSVKRMSLFRLKDGHWTPGGGVPGLTPEPPLSLITAPDQTLWMGFPKGGVKAVAGNNVHSFGAGDGLDLGPVMALHAARGTVWAGGEFGLARFDGRRFVPMRAADPQALAFLSGIVETADGDLWLNGRAGVVHIGRAELQHAIADPAHHLATEVLGAADGLEGTAARLSPVPSIVQAPSGELWFANSKLYRLDPAHRARNAVPPPIQIQSIVADDRVMPLGEGPIRLPERTALLAFDYLALCLTAPDKVHYRYRLDGVDRDWQDAGTRRKATYANLAPGRYRFHVIAANNDGVWNDVGVTRDLVLPPAFTQTLGFYAVCAALAGLLVWALLSWRTRQVEARLRARHEVRLAERERIARELHDTLLQSTAALVMRVEAVASRIPQDDATRTLLERTLERARHVMAEGRERVLDLRSPGRLASDDLLNDILSAKEDVADATSTPSGETQGRPRELTLDARVEVSRIAREAVVNALRHARAASVQVRVDYADAALVVEVIDDGRGIDPQVLESASMRGHWGVRGMRERAARMGATLDVRPNASGGTCVSLRVPAAVAYAAPERRGRW